jgi:hypothetical protein
MRRAYCVGLELGPRFLPPRPTTAKKEVGGGEGEREVFERRVSQLRAAQPGIQQNDRIASSAAATEQPAPSPPPQTLHSDPHRPSPPRTDVHEAVVVLQPLPGAARGLLRLVRRRDLGGLAAHLAGAGERAVDLACGAATSGGGRGGSAAGSGGGRVARRIASGAAGGRDQRRAAARPARAAHRRGASAARPPRPGPRAHPWLQAILLFLVKTIVAAGGGGSPRSAGRARSSPFGGRAGPHAALGGSNSCRWVADSQLGLRRRRAWRHRARLIMLRHLAGSRSLL